MTLGEHERLPGVRKIAALRANLLGDAVTSLPALEALKAAHPEAELVLLGRRLHQALLAERPGPVDRVVEIPPTPGVGLDPADAEAAADPVTRDAFFARMQEESFDLAVQLHGGGRHSNPFLLGLGARLTVGARTPDAAALDRCVPYQLAQHEVLRQLEVVGLAGARPITVAPRLAVTDGDARAAQAALPADERPLVALHPGATDPRRRWPPRRFAAVGDALADRGARVVVTGTPPEGAVVAEVVEAMRTPAENLCGRLSLPALVGLLARCRLLVANDTGPLHLAAAVDTPAVGLYWCGNLVQAGPVTCARQRALASWRLTCPRCGRHCIHEDCPHEDSFLVDLPVEAVTEPADELYGRR